MTVKRKSSSKPKGGGQHLTSPLADDESDLFRTSIGEIRPLPDNGRLHFSPHQPWPDLRQSQPNKSSFAPDTLSDHIPHSLSDIENEFFFQRPGVAPLTLKRLRRGYWKIQSELDLHGMTSDEARASLIIFLDECRHLGLRCVRVIHGKGLSSKDREPVLKLKTASWLMQREEVLAFCQARPAEGGAGAVIVLLKVTQR